MTKRARGKGNGQNGNQRFRTYEEYMEAFFPSALYESQLEKADAAELGARLADKTVAQLKRALSSVTQPSPDE